MPFLLLMFSCAQEEEQIVEEVATAPPVKVIDLSEGVFPLVAEVPENSKTNYSTKWNETFGRMEVSNDLGIELFISQNNISCAEKKREIESGIFEVNYAIDTDSLICYNTHLPDGTAEYWHVYASYKLGGYTYCFENNPLVEYNKSQAEFMVDFIGSVKPIKGD